MIKQEKRRNTENNNSDIIQSLYPASHCTNREVVFNSGCWHQRAPVALFQIYRLLNTRPDCLRHFKLLWSMSGLLQVQHLFGSYCPVESTTLQKSWPCFTEGCSWSGSGLYTQPSQQSSALILDTLVSERYQWSEIYKLCSTFQASFLFGIFQHWACIFIEYLTEGLGWLLICGSLMAEQGLFM